MHHFAALCTGAALGGRVMPKRKQKKARLSVSLTGPQKAALKEMADRYDISLARVIQEAIKEFLENHQDGELSFFERPPPKG
jgi:hypothetical protein